MRAAEKNSGRTGGVKSLAKGLAVLRAFGGGRSVMTVGEIARAAELDRAAARRFALTLRDLGYLSQEGRAFTPSAKTLELGFSFFAAQSWIDIALPHMRRATEETGETCTAAVPSGDDIVYVARTPGERLMTFTVSVGMRMPMHCTSMGRVILAGLPDAEMRARAAQMPLRRVTARTVTDRRKLLAELRRVRARGFSLVDGELEDDLVSLAAPLHDADGRVFAGLNVCAHRARAAPERAVAEYLPPLRAAAARIERILSQTRAAERRREGEPKP